MINAHDHSHEGVYSQHLMDSIQWHGWMKSTDKVLKDAQE